MGQCRADRHDDQDGHDHDVFNGYHMGITAEDLAERYQGYRAEQDEFA